MKTAILTAILAVALVACGGDRDTGAVLSAPAEPHRHAAGAPPNVVLIVLDTARADRMSYAGHARPTSPHVDALARDGVVYSRAHSVAPWTLPSHASIFTGLLPGEHGATWRAFDGAQDTPLQAVLERSVELPRSHHLARRLSARGYTCLGFSTNAWVSRRTGFADGFNAFYEVWRTIEPDWRLRLRRWRAATDLERGDAGDTVAAFGGHLERHGLPPEPFFLFFNFIDPHFPYSPPPRWRHALGQDRELGKRLAGFEFSEMAMVAGDRPIDLATLAPFYDAEISYVDFAVGRLLAWLKAAGLYDESLIVVTSDHGEHLGEGGRFGHQFSVEEALLHVPLVIKYPGGELAGTTVDDPRVSNLDVYATLLATAGDAGGEPPVASRDLGDMAAFDRAFLLAESYPSEPFLQAHEARHAAFPIDEHRVVRRVVLDGEARHVFLSANDEPPRLDDGDSSSRARAAAWLRRHLADRDDAGANVDQGPLDEETLERLRSLGYAD